MRVLVRWLPGALPLALAAGAALGLVDSVVLATAERLGARAIATLDIRDFAPVELDGGPELWPRDL